MLASCPNKCGAALSIDPHWGQLKHIGNSLVDVLSIIRGGSSQDKNCTDQKTHVPHCRRIAYWGQGCLNWPQCGSMESAAPHLLGLAASISRRATSTYYIDCASSIQASYCLGASSWSAHISDTHVPTLEANSTRGATREGSKLAVRGVTVEPYNELRIAFRGWRQGCCLLSRCIQLNLYFC